MRSIWGIASASALLIPALVQADASAYQSNAICTCDQMMRYYGTEQTGIWSESWWESAILLSSLADISMLDPDYGEHYIDTFATTFTYAPTYNNYTSFIDDFYDDEGWWANAWISAYDYTGNITYLNMAIDIYNDISKGTSNCGGIFWGKTSSYIASIANELYITLAASLANRVGAEEKQAYLDVAISTWDWFFTIGVVDDDWLIMDGVDNETCTASGTKYSYNQGVILSAAVELFHATSDITYILAAKNIADAVTTTDSIFTNSEGIITDCDNNGCDAQSDMFKGPLFRGMRQLQALYPHSNWADWMTTNAQALWKNALNVIEIDGLFECNTGSDFSGPMSLVSEITQGAALDCLVAAWASS